MNFPINKTTFLSLVSVKTSRTFVLSETDNGSLGHPNYWFLIHNKLKMLRHLLHIILFTCFFAQANGQVVFRAIGSESTLVGNLSVSVQVENFTNVAALQFSIVYDTSSLTFNGASDFGVPSASSGNFYEPTKGIINFVWFNSDNVTLNDNTIIFKLNFIAQEVKESKVEFDLNSIFTVTDKSSSPYPFEVYYAGINATYLHGQIFYDKVVNCQLNPGDIGLNDIPFRFQNTDYTVYGTTDEAGEFSYTIPTGNVTFSTLPRTSTWTPCTPSFLMNIVDYSENRINSFLQPNYNCPHMEVDVSTPYIQPCSEVVYWIDYRNNGSAIASDVNINITLDSFLTFTASNITPAQIDGQNISFNIGEVGIDGTGRFSITAQNSCTGTVTGQAQCVIARITPNEICDPVSPLWDGASLKVEGQCKDDSVQFKITNTSNVAILEKQYTIIEDMIFGYTGKTDINPGESKFITQKTDGHTYRLITNQSSNHPGKSFPTIALEGCDGYDNSTMLGSVTEFAEDDSDYFISKDCQESIETTPTTNTVTGHPKGYGPEFQITSHTELSYLIYFRNDADTMLTSLVIRDSLSENLDIISVQPGAASHAYDFSLEGANVVRFDFENLSINPGEDGFVKFRVSQKPNNPINTLIKNTVSIEMSGQELSTNSIFNTVGGDTELLYVMVDIDNPINPKVKLDVYPNPFVSEVTIELKEYSKTDLRLRLYGINGSVLLEQSTQTGSFQLSRSSLSTGTYVFIIEDNGQPIASGKLIVP